MKNMYILKLKGTLKLKVSGRNANYFIEKLVKSKIDIISIKKLNRKEIIIEIFEKDYFKIEEIKTIYDIELVDTYGIIKIKKLIKKHKLFIGLFLFGFTFLIFLSNVIFNIDIVHLDKDIREIIERELTIHGIEKYKLKKSYSELQKIKHDIINKHKDKIEWLEIEEQGTRYIIRIEERIIKGDEEELPKRHIIAKKDAIIKKVVAESGEIIRNINDYVKQGDIVISGEIKLYDTVKNVVSAKGNVYGETWYEVSVSYPLVRKVETKTNNKKKVLSINFLSKKINLFNFKKYKHKNISEKILFKVPLLPISLTLDTETEIKVLDEVNTIDMAINKAMKEAEIKMKETLDKDEYIIRQNSLKVDVKSSKIVLDVFFAIYENITDYKMIAEDIIIEE